ncbi:MAG: hypothetical protein QME41_08880 [Actinomycetota bacterium]|nr:hypothetical protein [Actinomycetota bacterium]
MKKYKRSIQPLVFLGLGVLMATGLIISLNGIDAKPVGLSGQRLGESIASGTGVESEAKNPDKFVTPPVEMFYTEVATIGVAKEMVDFIPRVPKSPPGVTLKGVQVKKFPRAHRGIRLDYGKIVITIDPSDNADDYATAAKEMPGIVKLTNIAGMPAFEIEKGEQEIPGEPSVKHQYNSVIGWYEKGIKYTVHGEGEDVKLSDLRTFVETMFN